MRNVGYSFSLITLATVGLRNDNCGKQERETVDLYNYRPSVGDYQQHFGKELKCQVIIFSPSARNIRSLDTGCDRHRFGVCSLRITRVCLQRCDMRRRTSDIRQVHGRTPHRASGRLHVSAIAD